ncbi:hypothetical protein SNE40_017388 [Patella caerulea]|uniref:Cadherin domain-containing protein n=1 Tax=Patella caerulea TaxID=87958 RepID=A0AAN8P9N5_PATCE
MACFTLLIIAAGAILPITNVSGQIVEEMYYDLQEEREPLVRIADLSRDSNVSSVISSRELPLLSFRLFSSTGSTNFHLDNSTGILSSRERINRETVCRFQTSCVLTLNVGIQSLLAGSSFFQTLTVSVRIVDINDNSPIFSRSTAELSFLESSPPGTSFLIDGATDLDTGANNSIQSYSLVPTSDIFSLKIQRKLDGSMEVSIVLKSLLDRETISRYELTVVSQDGGQPRRSGEMKLYINVTDVNDNKPRFLNTVYNVSVNETAPVNVTIVTVSATDPDSNQNGQITYRFSSRQTDFDVVNYFSVNSRNGDVYPIASLTPLQGQIKSVVVEAKDGGVESKISQCIVHVTVLDNVNTPPVIRLNLVSANHTVDLSEATSVGSLVAHFVTEDVDSGINGDVSCQVINSTEFSVRQIKTDQYKIILNQVLDREVKSDYQINLVCQDGGQPPLQTKISLTVLLYDVNDNPPVVQQSEYFINISENNESGFKLLQVRATDRDVGENGHVMYKLGHVSEITSTIQVNETTGDVILLGSFDYEAEKHVNISIIAVDEGTPPLSAIVNVYLTITDENDNSPYFNEPVYIFNVKENSAPGAFVGKLQAHDVDSGNNGRLNYRIKTNSSLPFILSKDGYLSTQQTLDREKQALYSFIITAYDLGIPQQSGDVLINVAILDENDNKPIIKFPNSSVDSINVFYQAVPGTELLRVEAVDDDEGDNSRLIYELKYSEKPDYFIIDENSGVIFLNKQLRLEDCGNTSVSVKVSDRGLQSKSVVVNFTMIITEGNSTSLAYINHTEHNMLIVIIIVSVTLVVAILVLTIVLLLKRTDKQKHLQQHSQYDMKNLDDTIYKKGVHVYHSGETTLHLKRESLKDPPSSNNELIVFKMKLAEKYQVDGGDCSFSKETEMSDVLSSVSGETNGCDSGRGASEGEGQDDGATSVPNSPRKQMMTFKGSIPPPSYFGLEQMRSVNTTTQPSHHHTRHNVNATDSLKIKASGNRSSGLNKENFTPNSEKYDNQGSCLKHVSENYQYLHNSKYKYDNGNKKQTTQCFNKQNNLIFTQNGGGFHQHNDNINTRYGGRTGLRHHRMNYRNNDVYNHDMDMYSVDTVDDGHSTTTSGSYTVDNDQFVDDLSIFPDDSYHVTYLGHNPQDVYV